MSGMERFEELAAEAVAHNVADVFENGPGIRRGRRTAVIAVDPHSDYVLMTGLGGMGVGSMWIAVPDDLDDDYGQQFLADTREAIEGGCPEERAVNSVVVFEQGSERLEDGLAPYSDRQVIAGLLREVRGR